jgi:AraC family transcriptional regulator, L-rhamnose operon transcriptional activator RhaR
MSVKRYHWTELPGRPRHEVHVYRHVRQADHGPHDHEFFELAVVLGGRAFHDTLYGRRPLGRGDAFTMRPGAWHAFTACERLVIVVCVVQTHLLEHELQWVAGEPRLRLLLWPSAGIGDGIVRVKLSDDDVDACDALLEQLATPPGEEPRSHYVAYLLLLLRRLAGALEPAQLADAARLASAPAAVLDALHLLAADPARAWTLHELAGAVALSPTHLSRLFHRTVGRPPMTHLSALRAEAAAKRLLRSNEPVSSVGAAVGWADPNYFARRFRAHFGTSPSEFRSRALQPGPSGQATRRLAA